MVPPLSIFVNPLPRISSHGTFTRLPPFSPERPGFLRMPNPDNTWETASGKDQDSEEIKFWQARKYLTTSDSRTQGSFLIKVSGAEDEFTASLGKHNKATPYENPTQAAAGIYRIGLETLYRAKKKGIPSMEHVLAVMEAAHDLAWGDSWKATMDDWDEYYQKYVSVKEEASVFKEKLLARRFEKKPASIQKRLEKLIIKVTFLEDHGFKSDE